MMIEKDTEISIVSDNKKAKKDALTQFGLSDKLERHPQSLSGGEKQRLLLASHGNSIKQTNCDFR